MKERPILFSAPMVRAILEGRKSQTRRVVKPQPPDGHGFAGFTMSSTCRADVVKAVWGAGDPICMLHNPHRVRCPYGQRGDRLWVRETLQVTRHWRQVSYAADDATCYESDASPADERAEQLIDRYGTFNFEESRGVPSIHMPRWASRILLEVTDVRVERLQAISKPDALAEGITHSTLNDPLVEYQWLWESINGSASWNANPWVWAISFRRLESADCGVAK
jgi:hypothetical protein